MSLPPGVTFIQQDEYECEFRFYLIISIPLQQIPTKKKNVESPGTDRSPLGPWGVGMRPEAASGPGQGPWGSGGEPCVCEAGESLPLSLSTPKRTRLAAQPHSPSAGSPCTASRPAAGWWRRPASGGCTPSAPSRHGRTWQKGIISVKLKTLDGTKHYSLPRGVLG